jgi:DNA replication protein DnaC
MLVNPTVEKLHELRLGGMATALAEQLERPDRYTERDFTTRLGLLIDREAADRDNRRLARNLKTARLRTPACVEDIDFRRPRGLDRAQVLALAQAGWVAEHRDLLITGATGAGKTYLACALAQAAIPDRPGRSSYGSKRTASSPATCSTWTRSPCTGSTSSSSSSMPTAECTSGASPRTPPQPA